MGDVKDEEQALQRQVEELTMPHDRQEALSDHGQCHGYSTDESDVNPFANRHTQNDSLVGRDWRALDFIKVDKPKFHGRLHPEEFLDWLNAIENYFDFKDILETQQVKLVATRFRGYASVW
ncbi:hypothetical protein MRB53_026612 [Persea americana]|uniref:Uncharacterized protein n=1 Tax=Persea americana TaxID=3435 RepID=A0ACC2LJ80_PERAE|nr:hypothetical protein MRB53_026612 [Persea americana]